MRRRLKIFTLVELLVTIAIIAILASLLLPALRQARDMAVATNCMGNLRQVGLVMNSYVNDFDGWSPHPIRPGSLVDTWTVVLRQNGYWAKDLGCPFQANGSYGMRVCGQCWNDAIRLGSPKPHASNNPSRIWSTPSSMVLAGDSLELGAFKSSPQRIAQHWRLDDNNTAQAAGGVPHTRHLNAANILFGDGHAGAMLSGSIGDEVRATVGWTWVSGKNVPLGAYAW